MTVSTTDSVIEYEGNGVTTAFPVPFKFPANGDLVVTRVYNNVSTVLSLETDYTVVGAGVPAGGSVITTVAPPSGSIINIERQLDPVQETDLRNQGRYFAETHENVFDYLTMLIQQGNAGLSRALRRPVGKDYFDAEGRRISNVLSPVEDNDAANKLWTQQYVASIINSGTGPLNLASNVLYTAPDGVLRTVQDMSSKTDASKGASLVGWNRSYLNSAIDTVKGGLDSNPYNIFEFANLITNKPNLLDSSTWDWAPAIYGAINQIISIGGGVLVFPAGHSFKCLTKVGGFVNASNITLLGYGAEIVNYTGPLPMMTFGDGSTDIPGASGRYTNFSTTVRNIRVMGLSFRSGNPFGSGSQGSSRWADATPLQFHTARDVVVRDCSFTDLDFSAVDFGAACRDCLVDNCHFYSSQVEAGHANYGVRIFCYSVSVNSDISPTDPATGLLKSGYSLPPSTGNFGHENINVTNCYFENLSHGVMVFAGRRGVISNNRFVNMSTRSISITTYSSDYLCSNNNHSLNTNEQTSSGVSVFYNFGQQTFRNSVKGDKFLVLGSQNSATGFSPIKAQLAAHDIKIEGCDFNLPSFNGGAGQFCIVMTSNSDGCLRDNTFNCPSLNHPMYIAPAEGLSSPGFQQPNIEIIGNIIKGAVSGFIQLGDTTSSAGNYIIKDNIMESGGTRFIVHTASTASSVPRLFMSGNKFVNSPVRYVDNNSSSFKAVLRSIDTLEIITRLTTGSGVNNPSTTAVSFDFSGYTVPACFSNGVKQYQFTPYGGRENSQNSNDFIFSITGETATSVSGNIIRNSGSGSQTGYVSLRVIFTPFIT